MGAGDSGIPIGIPRDRNLTDLPRRASARGIPPAHEVRVGFDRDHVIAEGSERLDRFAAGHRDADLDAGIRDVPDPCGVDAEVLAVVRHELSRVQFADDLDRLGEHRLTRVDARPPFTHDVLIEVLARSEPEEEPPLAQDLQGRRLLSHDGGVVSHRGACDIRHELDATRGLRDGSQHGPGVRSMTLTDQPGGVVVARHFEVEADGLGGLRVADELERTALLGHEGVAESGHEVTARACGSRR